ncbi:hypothetical protein BURK1_00656 [Burkholderiales bacterium]|nr:hypothetical protein BURK1_00656 [Burkholderiales bacterium]
MIARRRSRAGTSVMTFATPAAPAPPDAPAAATHLGLHPEGDFVVTTGDASPIAPSAAFYFANEWIAVPRDGVPVSGFARGVRAFDDVRAWAASRASAQARDAHPPLVWLASPSRLRRARLAPDASRIAVDGRDHRFALAPRLALNRSWFDATSAAFLAARDVALRGRWNGDTFVARTLWPEDFRLDDAARLAPLPADRPAARSLRDLVRADGGGARAPFSTRLLWKRDAGTRPWAGKAALVVMVNGSQGDDDEAWGGHFALGTGRVGADGGIADLVVDNFYSLDIESEKGILAAPVPLDNYLADLNSGQAWYRPSALLVGILADDGAAARVQGALDRVYAQFWRHQLPYRHSTMNCTGISVDTLRAMGWNVPANDAGAAEVLLAWLAVPWTLARTRSVEATRTAYEYLTQDRTRLFPAVAFETLGADLLRLATGGASGDASEVERLLARDLEALVWVRVPQFPSSRAFGSWPIASPAEYERVVPKDPEARVVVPVPPRAFPPELRDPDLLPVPRPPSDLPLAVWGVVATATLVALVAWAMRTWVG